MQLNTVEEFTVQTHVPLQILLLKIVIPKEAVEALLILLLEVQSKDVTSQTVIPMETVEQ